jgi:hypothetical protein
MIRKNRAISITKRRKKSSGGKNPTSDNKPKIRTFLHLEPIPLRIGVEVERITFECEDAKTISQTLQHDASFHEWKVVGAKQDDFGWGKLVHSQRIDERWSYRVAVLTITLSHSPCLLVRLLHRHGDCSLRMRRKLHRFLHEAEEFFLASLLFSSGLD